MQLKLNSKKIIIPEKILEILRKLEEAGFEAFIVGGSVRDLLLNKNPKDWDITTKAKPKEILQIFPNGKYENKFGTVIVPEKYIETVNKEQEIKNKKIYSKKTANHNIQSSANIEITTYRIESKYSDRRRPDKIKFAKTLEEDLGRRDFTCNALALQVNLKVKTLNFNSILNEKLLNDQDKSWKEYGWRLIDLFDGIQDIQNKVIRAVGDPNERFNEDALRMMRAVRFASELSSGDDLQFLKDRKGVGRQNKKIKVKKISECKLQNILWKVGNRTFSAIKKNKDLLKHISAERTSDEFQKIILSKRPAWGVELLVETGLMKYVIPEIYDTIGVRQNRHHYYGPYNTVFKHLLAALKTCPSDKLEVRLAAFFHDIGKPKSKRGRGFTSTFYGHEYISARMTKDILERLKFPRQIIDKTTLLVKNHMFYYNVDEVGEKGVRKVVRKVGLENINDLIDVRIGDRLGSGVAKAVPYKLRHFKYMVEKVSQDPISVKQLNINGNDLISELKIKPSPKIGAILEVLLAEVIDEPNLNKKELLLKRADKLQSKNLKDLKQKAKQKIAVEKQEEDKEIKNKYWVK